MSEVHEQAVIDAPVASVWALVGDPARYPDWVPRVFEIQGERFDEGAEFIQISHQPLFGRDEAAFLIDEVDELHAIRMHCTLSGMYAHWQLADAQGGTFVDATFGLDPMRRRDRVIDAMIGRRFFRRWLAEAMESLDRAAIGAHLR